MATSRDFFWMHVPIHSVEITGEGKAVCRDGKRGPGKGNKFGFGICTKDQGKDHAG